MDNDISGAKPEVLRAQSVKRLNKHIIAWVVIFCISHVELRWR